MYRVQRSRNTTKKLFLPKKLISLSAIIKRRAMNTRLQAIKAELAARTLYVVDGDEIVM